MYYLGNKATVQFILQFTQYLTFDFAGDSTVW